MVTEASFEALRKVQLQEKNYSALAVLEADFFEKYRVLLGTLREKLRNSFSLDAAASLESTQRLLSEVLRRREQKIFLKALRDFQAGEVSSEGLAREEKEVYGALVKLLAEYEARQLDSPSAPQAGKDVSLQVKLLVDLPAFVGTSGELGPFTAGQKTALPPADARLLIEQGVAQEA